MTAAETIRFTGKEWDGETGLDYSGARYFSGAQARFTSPDAGGQLAAEYSSNPPSQSATLYLTDDPLGSTRLVSNAAGSPVGYDDYLPFGKEIPSGTDGRGSLYYATDGVTQKFTGKERDVELAGSAMQGLDFFLTRYFSSAQGRFTSTDPLPWLHWQQARGEDRANFRQFISDPQNFNLYAYARNNPLRFSDPTGMYYCTGTTAQCAGLKKAYEQAQAAANSKDLTANQRAAVQRVLKFLGRPGEVNGVVATFARTDAGTTGNTDVEKQFGRLITTITLNPTKFAALDSESRAETFVHEGRHGVDDAGRGRGPETWAEELTTERNAYGVQSFVSQGSGVASRWGLWDPAWSSPQAEINRQKAIETNAQKSAKAACADGGCQ
jgi:RHS repeat-associated protein